MRLGVSVVIELETQIVCSPSNLPAPDREYRFHPVRKWRFDYAWPKRKIALEVEGGTYCRGRHVRPQGYERDCEKYNAAALLGWTVLRATTAMVNDGRALALLEEAFNRQPCEEIRA
jgi:very-short-patch-repair endonuclease